MRVLLVGDYPPPHGGIAVHVKQLHAYLRERQVPCKVLDIGKGGGRPQPDVIPARTPHLYGWKLAQFFAAGWQVHLHTSGNNRMSWMVAGSIGVSAPPWGPPPVLTLHSGLLPQFLGASAAHRMLA